MAQDNKYLRMFRTYKTANFELGQPSITGYLNQLKKDIKANPDFISKFFQYYLALDVGTCTNIVKLLNALDNSSLVIPAIKQNITYTVLMVNTNTNQELTDDIIQMLSHYKNENKSFDVSFVSRFDVNNVDWLQKKVEELLNVK